MPKNRIAYSMIASSRKYFKARLADPWLIEQAVVVTYGKPNDICEDLAVPVGGSRRGGAVSTSTNKEARQVIEQLSRFPNLFPNLHLIPAGPDYMANACWGEPEPDMPPDGAPDYEWAAMDRAMGERYGYSDSIIARFILQKYGLCGADY